MSAIYVCAKSQVVDAVRRIRPSHLITLLDPDDHMPTPDDISGHRHLRLGMHDIAHGHSEYTAPDEMHVRELITFAQDWDRSAPILIHCWAGVSRSTASAFTIACMLNEPGREKDIANMLRARASHAQPNQRIVAIADDILKRDGRMLEAIDSLSPSSTVYEGVLFALPLKY